MWALESEILKQRSEHLRFREPHCHLAPLPRVPVRIFAQTLHFQKLESLTYILPLAIWVQISLVGSEKRLSTRVRFGRSRSSKVIDFVTNQKRICDFLLVRHTVVTLVLSCTVSEISHFFLLMTPPLYFTWILGCSRWTKSPMLGSMWAIRPLNYFRSIPTYVIPVPEHHGQTTYCGISAFCEAPRGKKSKFISNEIECDRRTSVNEWDSINSC